VQIYGFYLKLATFQGDFSALACGIWWFDNKIKVVDCRLWVVGWFVLYNQQPI